MCSLLCGCKGRCYLRLPLSATAATDAEPSCGDADGGGGVSDGGQESDWDASGVGAESGGGKLTEISGEGGSGSLGWFLTDPPLTTFRLPIRKPVLRLRIRWGGGYLGGIRWIKPT